MENKGETLMRENYEKHSFKELKLIIEQKIMSKVLMNSKTTQLDIEEYTSIMQAAMDERPDNDGEQLLLPTVIAGQVYPNNRVHKFYAPVEYKKSPLAVQAMHRACVIFNLYVERRQLMLKRPRENDEGTRRTSPRLGPSAATGRTVAGNVSSSNAPNPNGNTNNVENSLIGTANSMFSKSELSKLKRDDLVVMYKKIFSVSDSTEVNGTKEVLIDAIITKQEKPQELPTSTSSGDVADAPSNLTIPTTGGAPMVEKADGNDEGQMVPLYKNSLKLTIIWTFLQNYLTFSFINELLEESAINQTEFWQQGNNAYPLFLKIRMVIMAMGTKKYLTSDHTKSSIIHEAKSHPGIVADTLEAYKEVKRTFKNYIDRLDAVSSDQDTAANFADELNYAFIKALLRKYEGGWVHTSVTLVNQSESTWTTRQTIDSLAVKIDMMLNVQKQTGFHAAMVTRETPILQANIPVMAATIACAFCTVLHAKGVKLYDHATQQVTREINCNHPENSCTMRYCKHCNTTFATPEQFHTYDNCHAFKSKRIHNANYHYGGGRNGPRGPPRGYNYQGYSNNNNPRGYPRFNNAYMANTWDHQVPGSYGYPYQGQTQHMMQGQGQYQQANTGPQYNMVTAGHDNVPQHIHQNPSVNQNGTNAQMHHNQVRILSQDTNPPAILPSILNQVKLIVDSGATESAINDTISNTVQQLLPNTTTKPRKIIVQGINNYTTTIDRALMVGLANGDQIVHNIMTQRDGLLSVGKLTRQLKIKMLFDENQLDIIDVNTNVKIDTVYQQQGLYTMTIPQYINLIKRMTHNPLEEIFQLLETKTIFIGSAFHRITLTDKIKKFISDIHQNYGHPGTSRLIATILSNVAYRNLDFNNHMELKNPFILAAVIRKYYSKHHCIVCVISNKKRRIPRYEIITDIPDNNCEICYIDWKAMSHADRYGNIGTHFLVCKRSTYVMVKHVTNTDPETTVDVIRQLVADIKILGYEIRTMFCDGTSGYQPAARLLQVNIQPLAANSQYRNNAERTIQVVYLTYAKNYSGQYLLDHSFWSDGIDTAVSQYNITVNEKTEDVTPHEMIFNSAPVIPAYKWGQPVIVSKNAHKIDSKITHKIGRGFPAVVVGIDNTNLYGAKVYKCGTYDGTIVGRNLIALHDDMDKLDSKYDKLEIISKFGVPKMTGSRRKRFHIDLDEYKRDVEPPPPDLHVTVVTPDEYDDDDAEVYFTHESSPLFCTPCTTTNLTDHIQIKPNNINDLSTELTENQYDALINREPSVKNALETELKQQWVNALYEEILKLQQYNIGQVIDRSIIPVNTQIIPTKFALTIKKKYNDGRLRFYARARLCGRGDLQMEYEHLYSPTIRLIVVMIILALHVQYEYSLVKFDVVGAFLQTPVTDENIYVSLPTPIFNKTIIKLKKYLYGLKSSNQKFYQYFSQILIDYGMQCIQEVEALFITDDIILLLHVDDGILIDKSKDNTASTKLLNYINSRCEIQTTHEVTEYLKLYITRIPNGIKLHQTPTVDKMHVNVPTFTQLHNFMTIDLDTIPTVPLVLTYITRRHDYLKSQYYTLIDPTLIQHITGSLIHVAYITRPTLQLAIQLISKYQNKATEYDLYYAYKLLQYTKATKDHGIIYTRCNNNDFGITMISDAAHMFHDNLIGQTSYSIILGHCLLTTIAKKASRPTLSAMETETHGHTNGARSFVYIFMVLKQLSSFVVLAKPKFITDSLSLLKLIHRKRLYTDRVKHFINELSYIKYIVETYDITTIHCSTHIMVMDILTKLNTTNTQALTTMLYDIATFFHALFPQNARIIDVNTSNEYKTMSDETLLIHITQPMITTKTD